MDVLKPELEIIDDICYRINPLHHCLASSTDKPIYNEEDCSVITAPQYLDEDETEFLNGVEEIDGGRHKTSFHVPNVFFSYIIGSKGNTRKRLETETRTKIIVPRQGQSGDIVITGPDKYSVARARKRIKGIVFVQKNRSAFTHFISIPFTDATFQQGYLIFKGRVLETCQERGIDESIFQSEDKLHLTICTLVLCDDVDRAEASNALQECKEIVISPILQKKLELEMTGIEYMNDDPTEVDVLYGKISCPDNPKILQEISDGIVSFFCTKDIINRQYDHVKLHVTLMNTLFRHGASYDEKEKIRETFDASNIMKNFANYHFGKAVVNQIEISLRYSSSKTGYYQATSSITIP
uniref:Putative activating signal cointegrator 1 complex subunit 1 n=1 Tax=Rhodnius prolixus TaxID=13249 RepID=R4FP12_RHOPR